jgi:hydrogenase maturation protease
MAGRPSRIVLGIGNPDRGDDAAGPAVARLLKDTLTDFEVAEHGGEAAALLGCLDGVAEAYLVDACVSDAAAGTVRRFDAATTPLPRGVFGLSSHSFGLAEAVELGRALGRLPPRCIVYAIEGGGFEAGEPLSPPVQAAVADVVSRIRAEIMGEDHREERHRA